MHQLRKKKHDLALLHEECELNFRRLHRLLPNIKKIGEESAEFVMACKDDNKTAISNEAADLIFHLQVLGLNKRNV